MKTKKEVAEIENKEGKIMMLSCNVKSKEERVKGEENCKNERASTRGKNGIKFRNKTYR